MKIKSEFTFFKAGQGAFYGGRIWVDDNHIHEVFTIVYDCGTSNFIKGNADSLNREIDYFSSKCNNKNMIDLLFISHLDYDHVSGLKNLLKKFNIKKIVLPYIEEKYIPLHIFSYLSIDNNSNKLLSLDDYIFFLKNPIEFIEEFSREAEVIFIKPNENSEIVEYSGGSSDDIEIQIYRYGDLLENDKNVYKNNLQFFIGRVWEFTTYVKDVDKGNIDKLYNCLKNILKKKIEDNLSTEDLKDIVLKYRIKAKECYKNIGDINSYGLILLHGPISFDILEYRIYPECEFNNYYPYNYYRYIIKGYEFSMLGTLLLGDTSLNPNKNCLNFPEEFKNKLRNVHIFQVPHHGSSKNWNKEEFKKLKIGENFNDWQHKKLAVCNFGYGNPYRHPSPQVLSDLCSSIFLNTQFSRLKICYKFIY